MKKIFSLIIGLGIIFNFQFSIFNVIADDFVPSDDEQNASNIYILDADDTGGDIKLQFGATLNEYIQWGSGTLRFDISDDLRVDGNLELSGSINPGFTQGSIVFAGTSGLDEDNTNLFWDDTNNRLGIGTATPTSILHMEQNHDAVSDATLINNNSGTSAMTRMRFENDISGGGVGIVSSNSSMTNYANRMLVVAEDDSAGILLDAQDSNGDIVFYTGDGVTERAIIDSSGNVGVGTATPGSLLHVEKSTSTGNDMTYFHNPTGGGGGTVLHIETQAGNIDEAVLIENDGTGAGLLIDGNASNSISLNIDSEGTSSHAFQLTHRGDGNNTTGAAIDITAENGSGGIYIYRNQAAAVTNDSLLELFEDNATADVPVMVIDNDGTGNSLSIMPSGDVGTSTSTDGALYVNGDAPGTALNVYSRRGSAIANMPLVTFREDNNSDQDLLFITNNGTGNSFRVDDQSSDTSPFVIDDTGNVGIGIAAPSRSLEVYNGNAQIIRDDGSDVLFTLNGDSNGIAWTIGNDDSSNADFIISNTGDLSDPIFFIGGSGGSYNERVGIRTTTPSTPLDIEANGTVFEIGNATANDIIINFDDGADRNFGWDDSESALSTFDNQMSFRTIQSTTPPAACSATVAGMQWMDTDTGILYICDTSNSRNKWLSVNELVLFGDESGSCGSGSDPNTNSNCNVDWGNGLGPDGNTDLGLYIPHPITITGYGFSEDNDACTSGSFDVEVWGTGSNTNDNSYTLSSTIASGLTGQAHAANNLNADVAGDEFILWGIDNNCGQSIDDWNVIIYFRYRHN